MNYILLEDLYKTICQNHIKLIYDKYNSEINTYNKIPFSRKTTLMFIADNTVNAFARVTQCDEVTIHVGMLKKVHECTQKMMEYDEIFTDYYLEMNADAIAMCITIDYVIFEPYHSEEVTELLHNNYYLDLFFLKAINIMFFVLRGFLPSIYNENYKNSSHHPFFLRPILNYQTINKYFDIEYARKLLDELLDECFMSTQAIINISLQTFGELFSLMIVLCMGFYRERHIPLDRLYLRILLCNILLLLESVAGTGTTVKIILPRKDELSDEHISS